MRDLVQDFVAKGGRPFDAPVTGSVDAAIRGDMPMFVGGEDAFIWGGANAGNIGTNRALRRQPDSAWH